MKEYLYVWILIIVAIFTIGLVSYVKDISIVLPVKTIEIEDCNFNKQYNKTKGDNK